MPVNDPFNFFEEEEPKQKQEQEQQTTPNIDPEVIKKAVLEAEMEKKRKEIENVVNSYLQKYPEFKDFLDKKLKSLSVAEFEKLIQAEQIGDIATIKNKLDEFYAEFEKAKTPEKQQKEEPPKVESGSPEIKTETKGKGNEIDINAWKYGTLEDKIKIAESLVEDDLE